MVAFKLPKEVQGWVRQLSGSLHQRLAWRLSILAVGLLFASGRRTVASWLRAAQVGKDYKVIITSWVPSAASANGSVVACWDWSGIDWAANGPTRFLLSTIDPEATVAQILEAYAERSAIEQDFHDLKEVHGAGQVQLRNHWANVGAFNLTLWLHTLVELWAWEQPAGRLLERRRLSPCDDVDRRPSHADRCNALRRQCVRQRITRLQGLRPMTGAIHAEETGETGPFLAPRSLEKMYR